MKLTVVGCAGSFPNATSPASSYLVEHDGYALMLDLGNGSFGALATYRDVRTVDAVALSHLHPDHCADVCGLYVSRRYNPAGMLPAIPVVGPTGLAERLDEMYGLAGRSESMSSVFEFEEYSANPITLGPFSITTAPVRHCVPAFALKVEAGGQTLVYSGDTGPCQALQDLAVGADLALFEGSNVSTVDNPPDLHMSGKQAGALAQAAGVSNLVLTHFVAWNDTNEVMAEARDEFDGNLSMAVPGLQIDLEELK